MSDETIFINRELSWLDFNRRVLALGKDKNVPLAEQVKFLAIYGSNLDEFFMVRVGSLQERANLEQSKSKKEKRENKTNMTAAEQLAAIMPKTAQLQADCDKYYAKALEELAGCGYRKVDFDHLSKEDERFWKKYFQTELFPILSPQIVDSRHPFPFLRNKEIYLGVLLREKHPNAQSLGIIPISSQMERLHFVKKDGETQFALVEELVLHYASSIFGKESILESCLFRVTRNADIDVKEGMMDHDIDYREIMTELLKRRRKLAAVRLQVTPEAAPEVQRLLCSRLELSGKRVFVQKSPLDLSFFYKLTGRIEAEDHPGLFYPAARPMLPPPDYDLTEEVQKHDVLLSYPYQSIRPFIDMLKKAARDPDVISIKMTLYRMARESQIVQALMEAAENGKEVVTLVELRARFDEQNNIDWSKQLENAGCTVIYGFDDYKVHSKLTLITRKQADGYSYITQIGTGNYNEKTAKLYTDFSFITCDSQIGHDAADFFRNMALENTSDNYDILWVAPLMIKQNILRNIDVQIERARRGEKCGLFFKTNSITDKEVIDKLVEASQAGVPIDLFVRGISCILPGVEGYTDRVREVSIVGQLLEHSRVYGFGPREDCKLYLSSADLMTRNMDKRIEIAWPILNETLRNQVLGYLGICYSDTAKLRELLPDGSYTALGAFAERNENGEVELFDSQKYLIAEAQRMRLAAAELAARKEANLGGSARVVFPLGDVAAEDGAEVGANEVVTEEESEFVAHRSPELEAAEAKAVRDAADAMAAAATATAASVLEAVTKGVAQEVAALQAREPQGATAAAETAPAADSDPAAADPAAVGPAAEGPVAERAELGAEAAPAAAPAPAPAAEVEDAARPDDGRAIVPATVVEPTPAGNAITRFFRRLFGK